jgi:hypothetical protein
MAFSREDLQAYESKPQTQDPNHDPWGKDPVAAEPQVKAAAEPVSSAEPVTEPTEEGIDGSSTVNEADPVAATDASPEGEKDPEGTEEPADGRPRNRAQERITELVDERNAVKEYNKYLQSKLDELLRMQAGKSAQPAESESSPARASQAEDDDSAPTLETVGYDPVELTKKQNEWIQRQVNKQVNAAIRQIETRQSDQAVATAFQGRVAEFKKTAPDFDVVISNPSLPQLAPEAARLIVRSDNGPAVAYHLAKNPDVAVRVAKMDAVSQAAAIGRLEEQLLRTSQAANGATKEPSKAPKPVQAKVTQAPPPPKPVQSGSVVTKDISQMTMEEWVAHERGRKISERTARQKMRQAMK